MKNGIGEILIYNSPDGGPQIEVKLEQDTLWLSQAFMADLFGKDFTTIAKHIKNIYTEGELQEEETTTQMPLAQQEGKRVALINNVSGSQSLSSDQAAGLLRVLSDYAYALDVLDKYDHQILEIEATSRKQLFRINYESAMQAISGLRS